MRTINKNPVGKSLQRIKQSLNNKNNQQTNPRTLQIQSGRMNTERWRLDQCNTYPNSVMCSATATRIGWILLLVDAKLHGVGSPAVKRLRRRRGELGGESGGIR